MQIRMSPLWMQVVILLTREILQVVVHWLNDSCDSNDSKTWFSFSFNSLIHTQKKKIKLPIFYQVVFSITFWVSITFAGYSLLICILFKLSWLETLCVLMTESQFGCTFQNLTNWPEIGICKYFLCIFLWLHNKCYYILSRGSRLNSKTHSTKRQGGGSSPLVRTSLKILSCPPSAPLLRLRPVVPWWRGPEHHLHLHPVTACEWRGLRRRPPEELSHSGPAGSGSPPACVLHLSPDRDQVPLCLQPQRPLQHLPGTRTSTRGKKN